MFMGAERELSETEEKEVQKAANAEPWVHEVCPHHSVVTSPTRKEPNYNVLHLPLDVVK